MPLSRIVGLDTLHTQGAEVAHVPHSNEAGANYQYRGCHDRIARISSKASAACTPTAEPQRLAMASRASGDRG